MNKRYFFEEEIRKAKNLLTILAQVSARFWAEALISNQFMYKGEVSYIDIGYKSGGWRDCPVAKNENITAEQIMKVLKMYEEEACKRIERVVESDRRVARILVINPHDVTENPRFAEDGTKLEIHWGYGSDIFSFGG